MLLIRLSLRRTRSVPIRVKVLGSFRVGFSGGVDLGGVGDQFAEARALLPLAWPTTPSLTVIWPTGTFQRGRRRLDEHRPRPGPGLAQLLQELEIADEPPVSWMPAVVLP